MRPIERIDRIQNKVAKIWKRYPDLRYFQFILWLASMIEQKDLFYYEDDDLEELLDNMLGGPSISDVLMNGQSLKDIDNVVNIPDTHRPHKRKQRGRTAPSRDFESSYKKKLRSYEYTIDKYEKDILGYEKALDKACKELSIMNNLLHTHGHESDSSEEWKKWLFSNDNNTYIDWTKNTTTSKSNSNWYIADITTTAIPSNKRGK